MPDLWQYSARLDGSEGLSFLTGVATTGNLDFRTSQRPARQILNYRYAFDPDQAAKAEARFRAAPLADWLIPAWFERTLVASAIGSVDTAIAVDTNADYRDGGQAVAYLSDTEFAILEIDTVGAGVLNLSAPVGVDLAGTAARPVAVAPLRTGFFADGLRMEKVFRGFVTMSATFQIRDNIDLSATPYAQQFGIDVLTDPSVVTSPLAGSFVQPAHFIDNGAGPIAIEARRSVIGALHAISFVDDGLAARWRRKQWLHHIRGRDGAFWLPTWSPDLALVVPILAADTQITVAAVAPDPADYVGRHILIDDGAGYLFRQITAAAILGLNHRITIAATGRDMAAADISFLNLVRLDADELSIDQTGAVARIASTVKEVSE